jgi:hypothetical protein
LDAIILTELGKSLLVAFAADDLVLLDLSLISNLLNGNNPASTLSCAASVELVLVVVELKGELASASLLDVLSVGLNGSISHCNKNSDLSRAINVPSLVHHLAQPCPHHAC